MPEGPIIVILKEELQPFKHQRVIAAKGYTNKMDPHRITGQTLNNIKSWGKHLLLCFDDFTVRVHLMLFGSYRINSRGKHNASLSLQFENGEVNFYISSITLIDRPLNEVYDWSADVMSKKWDTEKAMAKLKAKPKALAGDVLLDQKIFSGVGNIIKNEVLFRVKIHPESDVAKIPVKQLRLLIKEAVNYSFEFLQWKKDFVLKKHWLAYNKKNCPRDNIPFTKAHLGKTHRRSFYCNKCQKIYV